MITDIKIFHGKELFPWIKVIADLRLTEFKNFPYLYVGDITIEEQYLTRYAENDHSILTVVYCDKEIAGISTGIPLVRTSKITADMLEIFEKSGINTDDYYYYGEFIVAPQFRNLGIAKKLFIKQSKIVKAWGFKNACLMTIDREAHHPLKPQHYISTDTLWQKFGFIKTAMKIKARWPTMMPDGKIVNTENTLSFWIAELE